VGFADDRADPTQATSEVRRLVTQEQVFSIVPDLSAVNPGGRLSSPSASGVGQPSWVLARHAIAVDIAIAVRECASRKAINVREREGSVNDAENPGPLDGLRVLDLTRALSGPFCSMVLADLGADVIKVEAPGGDPTRDAPPFTEEDNERAYGGYFASVNRGKRSIVLDLKSAEDVEVLKALVPTVDVVLENNRAGVMDRLGLAYEVLAELNPRLVYGAIRGFGDPRTGKGPYADWPAYDVVAQAMGGLIAVTGPDKDHVVKCGPSVADIYAGTVAVIGVLAAALRARETGVGQFVDVAMYDAVLSLCEGAAYQLSYTGTVPGPTGNGHPMIPGFDVYATADGHFGLGLTSDESFRLFCELMDEPDLSRDPRFTAFVDRFANRPALDDAIGAVLASRTNAELLDLLGGRLPVGPVNDMAAIYRDPHVAAREMLVELEQPDGSRPVLVAGQPIKMTASSTSPRRRPPRLDEHRREILAEAGLA
jgi:crotonobetainyl-CoA:carnitine CoA-transferase CaiB-like acyl-CoA transferase